MAYARVDFVGIVGVGLSAVARAVVGPLTYDLETTTKLGAYLNSSTTKTKSHSL